MSSLSGLARAGLRSALEAIVGPDGVLTEPDELMVFESDGLTMFRATADAVVFPRTTEEVAAVRAARQPGGPPVRRARGRDRPRRRVPPRRGRDRHRGHPDGADPGGGLREPARRRRARPGEPPPLPGARARGLLLRARPLEPAGVHDRRQRRQQLGRPAHAEVRRHDEPRARAGSRLARRRGRLARGQGPRPAGVRPRRPVRGLGGDVRDRDEGRRADRAAARRRCGRSWRCSTRSTRRRARWRRSRPGA